MRTLRKTGSARRFARDAAATFALFMALIALGPSSSCHNCSNRFGDFLSISAQAGELTKDVVADLPGTAASLAIVATPPPAKPKPTIFRETSPHDAWLVLAAVLSALTALNLAFARHLRRVNASPRRR